MVNSWSLLWEELNGTMDETYPIGVGETTNIQIQDCDDTVLITAPTVSEWERVESPYYPPGMMEPLPQTFLSDNDDQCGHHFNLDTQATSPYNDGWTQQGSLELKEKLDKEMAAHYFKYHEEEILKDIEEYVSATYRGHYTGTSHEYRKVQTLDLLAARDIASGFCQANIIKYGSRYGSKEGKEKKDLMKVIHYAMLLLHFDDHYGKPSITTGNIDHQMP